MKKQLLVGAFMLASFLTANAQQTTLLSQDFEGAVADIGTQGWSLIDFDGNGTTSAYSWGIYNSSTGLTALGFNGKAAGSANFTVDATANTATVIAGSDNGFWSPSVEIPLDDVANVSFRIGSASATTTAAAAHYSIYVINDADIQDITTAADFNTYVNTLTPNVAADVTDASSVVNVDLSDFAGESVSVIFRHNNNVDAPAYLFFDDVKFTSGVLGTQLVKANKFSVFPNPANNVVTVANANALINAIAVTDINGRTVKSVKVGGVAETQVNISDLASGVYMMSISSDKGTSTQKIIKN